VVNNGCNELLMIYPQEKQPKVMLYTRLSTLYTI